MGRSGGLNGTDLAVVMIPPGVTAGRDVDMARFGRISDRTAVLTVKALGFPRFKLRGGVARSGELEVFRDLDQLTGHAPVAANRRQGTLAVYLDDPPPASPEEGGPSPWEGMSGAAVWADGRIIGVVAEHHPARALADSQLGALTGPTNSCRNLTLAGWRAGSGYPRPRDGCRMSSQPNVATSCNRLTWNRSETSRPMCSLGATPSSRNGRTSALVPETYVWWQAGPSSGKSALASWFVAHPPLGVDVISFFITGRLPGQADSDAFLDAVIEQLNALDPAAGESPPVAGAREGVWLSLLAGAAAQAEERGRRLVLVVDGLDEDDVGAIPPQGTAQHRLLASPASSPWSPFHHHWPPRPWPPRRCAIRSSSSHLHTPPPTGVVGSRGCGKARDAGTTGPVQRRSDRHRCGWLCGRVWRWPDEGRPVGARRGSPPTSSIPCCVGCSAAVFRAASGVLPRGRSRSSDASVPVRA